MGDVNTNIRIDELISRYDAEIRSLKSDVEKLKTQNRDAIKLTLHNTGTLTKKEFENITSFINNGKNFVLYGEFFNTIYGVNETFRFGSFQKLWDSTNEEYFYVCLCNNKQLVINQDKSYEFTDT